MPDAAALLYSRSLGKEGPFWCEPSPFVVPLTISFGVISGCIFRGLNRERRLKNEVRG
jgi:hypothetical protein